MFFLGWIEQRENNHPPDGSKSRKHDYGFKGLVTATDAARILKISKSMMYQMIKRGETPGVRLGKASRVRSIDLENFIAENVK